MSSAARKVKRASGKRVKQAEKLLRGTKQGEAIADKSDAYRTSSGTYTVEAQGVDLGQLSKQAVKEMLSDVKSAERDPDAGSALPTRQSGVDHIWILVSQCGPNWLQYENVTPLPGGIQPIKAWGRFDKMAEAHWRHEYRKALWNVRLENEKTAWRRAGEAELHLTQLGVLGG